MTSSAEGMKHLVARIEKSGCNLCPELVNSRTKIVVAKGNPDADVVIIGQGPGAQEDSCGKPFSGPAGNLLHRIITDGGFNPESDFWFTNVTLCHVAGNARPTSEQMQNCTRHLSQIAVSQKKILAVGSAAVEGVLRAFGPEILTRASLSMHKLLTDGTPIRLSSGKWLFITYHPSYLLRSGFNDQTFPDYKTVLNEIKSAKAFKPDPVYDQEDDDKRALYSGGGFF